MQPLHHPHPPRAPQAPITPLARPQPGRAATPWPFYVQAPRPPCFDIELNAGRMLETSARYLSAPPAP